MSEFHVEVVRIGSVEKHPNADTLSITQAHGGYPVIFQTGTFHEGDLAVYVPIDAIVPEGERFAFLGDHRRIKAKRLRGVFSMGLLTPVEPGWAEGQNVQAELGIEKWEPVSEEPRLGQSNLGGPSDNESDPNYMPGYTDLEGLRRWQTALVEGEEVVATEKIHGCNARFVFEDGRLWVGSRTRIKRPGTHNVWNTVAAKYDLATRLAAFPGIAIFGEVYGQVQDLKYGAGPGELMFRMFDAFDAGTGRWLDYDAMLIIAGSLDLLAAPILYRGPWMESVKELRNGPSTLPGANCIREGIVIRPVVERFDPHNGRVIVKLVGENYLLRKAA